MKDTNILLYTAGAYGHFINWCCEYFSGNVNDSTVPLGPTGNCHSFSQKYNFYYPPNFKNYTVSNNYYQFIQLHENSFDSTDCADISLGKFIQVLRKNLTYLQEHYKKTVYVYPTPTSKVWIANNQIFKINLSDWAQGNDMQQVIDYVRSQLMPESEIDILSSRGIDRIKKTIHYDTGLKDNIIKWGHQSIFDFELWELREFSSKYYFDKITNGALIDQIVESELIAEFPNIKFIKLDDLKNNFSNTIQSILEFFDVDSVHWENINTIHQSWLAKQFYINSDDHIQQIVSSVVQGSQLDWSNWNLTFIDEFCIQRLLFEEGYDIKCWNLNDFPTSTGQLLPLMEKI